MKPKRTQAAAWLALSTAVALAGCGSDDSADEPAAGQGMMMSTAGNGSDPYPFVPCDDDLPAFGIGMEAVGEDGLITARLVDAYPAPPRKYRNDWTIDFVDASGAALDDIELTNARSYMPAHNHDGARDPDLTAVEDAPGRIQVDYLNLWMRGQWEVQLTASSASAGDDYIVFKVCVEE